MELKELQPIKIGEMVRVGDKEDGGYVIPAHFKNSRLNLISIGLGDNWSFESQGKGIFFDKFISVDHTVSFLSILRRLLKRIVSKKIKLSTLVYFLKLLVNYLQTFILKRNTHIRKKLVSAIDKKNKNEITLNECINRIEAKRVALKIDIEGDEYSVIEDVCRQNEKIILLIIEFHDTGRREQEFSKVISKLQEIFYLVHTHGNNFDSVADNGIPNVVELTFVNRNALKGDYEKIKKLPLPKIDYPCNPGKADIDLNF
jgi:hypothetical protein